MNKKLIIELQNMIRNKPDEVPDGWYTMVQLSKNLHRSVSSAKSIVKSLLENHPNRIKKKKFRIVDTSGRVQLIQHYKIK